MKRVGIAGSREDVCRDNELYRGTSTRDDAQYSEEADRLPIFV